MLQIALYQAVAAEGQKNTLFWKVEYFDLPLVFFFSITEIMVLIQRLEIRKEKAGLGNLSKIKSFQYMKLITLPSPLPL